MDVGTDVCAVHRTYSTRPYVLRTVRMYVYVYPYSIHQHTWLSAHRPTVATIIRFAVLPAGLRYPTLAMLADRSLPAKWVSNASRPQKSRISTEYLFLWSVRSIADASPKPDVFRPCLRRSTRMDLGTGSSALHSDLLGRSVGSSLCRFQLNWRLAFYLQASRNRAFFYSCIIQRPTGQSPEIC